jgi:hypothetical protein
MTIVQHDNMIRAIPPDTASDSFNKCILPRTSRRSEHLFNARALDALLELAPIDSRPQMHSIPSFYGLEKSAHHPQIPFLDYS